MSNKLKPGDTVELKTRTVRHFVKNLGLLYIKPESGEFAIGYASEVAMFLASYLKRAEKPVGKIVSYGARIDGTKARHLMVKVKNSAGNADSLPLLESDVTLVRKK